MKLKAKILLWLFIASLLVPFFSQSNNLEINVQQVNALPSLELEQKWNYTSSGTYVSGTPTLFDLYQDGTMEIIYGTGNQGLKCLDEDGNLNWTYSTSSVVRDSPAIVDIDFDYNPNIIVGINDRVRFLEIDGTSLDSVSTGYILGAPTIVDFEQDGEWEFLTPSYSFYDGIYCINSNGTIRWSYTDVSTPGTPDRVYGAPSACDLDGDGVIEVLFGSWDGYLYCLNETGDFQWKSDTGDQIWSSPTIVDVDDNGIYEIIIGSKSGMVYCFNYDGSTMWSQDLAHPIYSQAVIADIDNNNAYEVYIGVDGESGVSTPALHCLVGNTGAIDWYYNTTDGLFKAPAIADIDGDAFEEIIIVSNDGVISVLTSSGTVDQNMQYTMSSYATTSPVIADVDNDGYMDLFVGDGNGVMYCINVKYASSNFGLTRWHTLGGSMFRNGHADEDGDYLDNQEEEELGLTSTNVDSDNDQLDEGRELLLYHTDPTDSDSDSDLLTDGLEVDTYSTDPNDSDTDGDALTDYEETIDGNDGYQTDPTDSDSDDDSITDGDEFSFGTNPNNNDSDSDGLTDRFELDNSLDPTDNDTDDDLLLDGEEWNIYGSDPDNSDTDSDGLDDWEEVNEGNDGFLTSVTNNDTDSDGILDGDEDTYGTSPIDADSDDDGFSDGVEVAEGTDPNNDTDYPESQPPTSPTNLNPVFGNFLSITLAIASSFTILIVISKKKKK